MKKHQVARLATHCVIPETLMMVNYKYTIVAGFAFYKNENELTYSIFFLLLGNKLVRMATYTWQQRPVHRTKGIQKYRCITRFPHIRERLCILARHHMLLRDEDLRNLNLSDIFCTLHQKSAAGSRWASGFTFCLRRGKTNKKGATLYATAFRQKDFRRCTVGAFAFYLLERFMVYACPPPPPLPPFFCRGMFLFSQFGSLDLYSICLCL